MQCPTDGTTLVMSERSGIEIDYCPQCRGVWLDRGELDKIIERSATEQGAWANPPAAPGGPRTPLRHLRPAQPGLRHPPAEASRVLAQRALRLRFQPNVIRSGRDSDHFV